MKQNEGRTLLEASTDEDGNVHMTFDGWLSVWDEGEGRVLLHSQGGYLCALVARKRDGYLPIIRGGDGHGAYEPWTGFEDGELFVQGPCGRYLVRGYGPAGDEGCDEAEAVARYGAAHHVGIVQSFAAEYVEPDQQTLEGFAVYKRTDEGIRWIADLLTLGHALAVARDMAETGRAPSPYNGADRADLSPTDRAMIDTMDGLEDPERAISLSDAIAAAASLFDPSDHPADVHDEYVRGVTETLARCFPLFEVETGERAAQLRARIVPGPATSTRRTCRHCGAVAFPVLAGGPVDNCPSCGRYRPWIEADEAR